MSVLLLDRRQGEGLLIETSDGPIWVHVARKGQNQLGLRLDLPRACNVVRRELTMNLGYDPPNVDTLSRGERRRRREAEIARAAEVAAIARIEPAQPDVPPPPKSRPLGFNTLQQMRARASASSRSRVAGDEAATAQPVGREPAHETLQAS